MGGGNECVLSRQFGSKIFKIFLLFLECDTVMVSNALIELLGFTAGIIGLVAWIPQVVEVWYYKRHEGVSLPTIFSIVAALSIWTVYGILLNAPAMVISNSVTLLLIFFVAVGIIRLRYFRNPNSELENSESTAKRGITALF